MSKSRSKGIATLWLQDINMNDPAEKDARITLLIQGKPILDLLESILDKELERLEREEEDFKVPNWDVKMASLVGERKMIRFIKKLIPSDQYVEDKLKAI